MRILRNIGSLAFVIGLFTSIFIGIPWHVVVAENPVVPWWLRIAVFCLLGGILLVLVTLALEQATGEGLPPKASTSEDADKMLLLSSAKLPGHKVSQVLGLVQGHTVFAVWLGKDLAALARLILGGELTEYTQMMGSARSLAAARMQAQATELDADAVINVRYMTTSVVGSAAELLVYGTAVKLSTT